MKKLVMMLALVAAVISAKAASVDWKVTGAAAQENYTVYLLASDPGNIASLDDLQAAAVGSAVIAKKGSGSRATYGTGDQTSAGANVTKSGTYYYAIVSGSDATSFNYVGATQMANSVYDPNNQETSPGVYGNLSAAQIAAGTSKSFGGGDVPEPTTGLLLLVGGAMLALRRKQK